MRFRTARLPHSAGNGSRLESPRRSARIRCCDVVVEVANCVVLRVTIQFTVQPAGSITWAISWPGQVLIFPKFRAPFHFLHDGFAIRQHHSADLRNPRTDWACQPVASMISDSVTPLARFIIAINSAFLSLRASAPLRSGARGFGRLRRATREACSATVAVLSLWAGLP